MSWSKTPHRSLTALFEKITKHESTFTQQELQDAVVQLRLSHDERQKILDELHRHPGLLHLSTPEGNHTNGYLTTRSIRAQEEEILRSAKQLSKLTLLERLCNGVVWQQVDHRYALDGEQRTAFLHATDSGNLKLINGRAGTGKSHTISAIRQAFERNGKTVTR